MKTLTMLYVGYWLFGVIPLGFTICNATLTNETLLLQYLFAGYDVTARPVINASEQVQVDISLFLRSVSELNTKNELLSAVGWVSAYWRDERFSWNPDDYGGIDYIAVLPTKIWLPTFVLGNAVAASLYVDEWYKFYKVRIFSDGSLAWSPGGIFTVSCTVDINYFPFDDQICAFRFENWIWTGDKVNLSYVSAAEDNLLANYVENGIWDIVDVKVMRHDVYYGLPIPYPEVVFGIHFRRKILFYVTNIIVLSVLIGVLVLLSFKLPAESGEKVSMGVTLLLAYSVFILMVNESIPETSTAVPIIIIYLVSIMAVTTFSICESVLSLYCYHHSGEHRAPNWFRALIFNFIEPFLCKGKGQSLWRQLIFCETFKMEKETKVMHLPEAFSKPNQDGVVSNEKKKDEANMIDITKQSNGQAFTKRIVLANDDESRDEDSNIDEEEIARNTEEWQRISKLIDYFSFWLFVVTFVVLMLTMLVIVPFTQPVKNIHTSTEKWAGFTV